MIIKFNDRLTVESLSALRAWLKTGRDGAFVELFKVLQAQDRSPVEPPFRAYDPTQICFHRVTAPQVKTEISMKEAGDLLKDLRLHSPMTTWRFTEEQYQNFLKSSSHQAYAFSNRPTILGYAGNLVAMAQQGVRGSTYARTPDEIVAFLAVGDRAASVAQDCSMRFNYTREFSTLEDLKGLIAEGKEAFEFVMNTIAMASGAYFDLTPEGDRYRDHILQLNPEAHAIVNILIWDTNEPYDARLDVPAATARIRLSRALDQIYAFAQRQGLESEGAPFARAQAILAKSLEPSAFWKAAGHRSDQYVLWSAAIEADCFAGMASWNDVQVESPDEFHRTSNEVVLTLLEAAASACN